MPNNPAGVEFLRYKREQNGQWPETLRKEQMYKSATQEKCNTVYQPGQ